ncbi:MAG: hypothetical protein ABIP74_03015 [Candidatus Saccharimonas sp.]
MNVSLTFVDGDAHDTVQWQADRTLARDMLTFLNKQLTTRGLVFSDIKGIGVFRGPGSFTGLRIGLTVLNTWAHAESIPIVGELGDDWQRMCLERLRSGADDAIILPEYGAPAHVTKPRK